MTDPKDLEGIDEVIARLCRIEQGINELRLATHQIFVALARADPTATIHREDLEVIGEALIQKFGWPALQSLFQEAGLQTTGEAAIETQRHIAAYLALGKTKSPIELLKKLVVERA